MHSPLASFARHLRRDQDAVDAALQMPWSRGMVEGQIHRSTDSSSSNGKCMAVPASICSDYAFSRPPNAEEAIANSHLTSPNVSQDPISLKATPLGQLNPNS
jgi:hypothetical protein